MRRLDLMPIPILNTCKSEKAHTHTQRDLKEHPHMSDRLRQGANWVYVRV